MIDNLNHDNNHITHSMDNGEIKIHMSGIESYLVSSCPLGQGTYNGGGIYNWNGYAGTLQQIINHFDLYRYGVNKYKILKEIKQGETIGGALSKILSDRELSPALFSDLVKQHHIHISEQCFKNKVYECNGSIKKAIEKIKSSSRKQYLYKGEWKTLSEIVKEEKINPNTVKLRMRKGLTIYEALETSYRANTKKQYTLSNGFSGSLKECLNELGINLSSHSKPYKDLMYVLKNNITLEEALLIL